MKKIINQPESIVVEMCEGMALAHQDHLVFHQASKSLLRKNLNPKKVTLLCGGGSGHEPAHAGFVGEGMLDGAICGDVFASPSSIQVYKAILETQSEKGTLLIVKNYSGDCMNFDTAAEMAVEDDGLAVESVYVNDDVAVKDSLYTVGRRGVAGTIFVQKVAGAAAEAGLDLSQVKALALETIENVRSIGFALTSCTVPAKGSPTFTLGDDEMEFGVGIHGEPGIAREKMMTADEISKKMLDKIRDDMPIEPNAEVAIMVNGLGATPLQELYVLYHSVRKILDSDKIHVVKSYVGNYMTAIDMAGASLTVLKLNPTLRPYLEAPCQTLVFK